VTHRSSHGWQGPQGPGSRRLQRPGAKAIPGASDAPGGVRKDVLLILLSILLFATVAKFVHPLRPILILLLGFMVYVLARRSFHLGVSLYAMSFAFLSLMPGRLFGIPALNASNLMVIALTGFLLFAAAKERESRSGSGFHGVPLALAGVYVWLVVGVAVATVVNGVGLGLGVELLRKFFAVSVPFFMGLAVSRQGLRQRAFTVGMVLASVLLITSWAMVGFGRNLARGRDPSEIRLEGRLGQPNSVGAFVALYLPGFVALAAEGKTIRLRLLGWGGGALCISALFYTRSRGSILAAAGALAVLGVLRYRKLLAVTVLAVVVFGPWFVPDHVIQRFEVTFQGEKDLEGFDRSSYVRREMYRFAPTVIRASPVIGHGLGAYPVAAARLGRADLARSPHSWYLEVLTELGLVGFLVFGWLTVACFRSLWRRAREPATHLDSALATAMIGSTVALAGICFFQKPFFDNELITPFYFLGLGLALGHRAEGEAPPGRTVTGSWHDRSRSRAAGMA
jgi:O-antigen ligase